MQFVRHPGTRARLVHPVRICGAGREEPGTRLRRSALLVGTLMLVAACDGTTAPTATPQLTEILITGAQHHLGNDSQSEGANFNGVFTVSTLFDSASVSITFVYPNSVDKAPEMDAGAPRIFVNNQQIGLTAADFPNIPGCIQSISSSNVIVREYICNATIVIPATAAVTVGANTIRVASEVAFGGDDDFVFTNLLVRIWH